MGAEQLSEALRGKLAALGDVYNSLNPEEMASLISRHLIVCHADRQIYRPEIQVVHLSRQARPSVSNCSLIGVNTSDSSHNTKNFRERGDVYKTSQCS